MTTSRYEWQLAQVPKLQQVAYGERSSVHTDEDVFVNTSRSALVVDGDSLMLTMLGNVLRGAGFVTTCERTGKTGKACLDKQPFDLALINAVLPDISGLGLCAYAREHYGYGSIIVVMSAPSHVNLRVTALQVGADDFVVVPFDMQEFILRIEAKFRLPRLT